MQYKQSTSAANTTRASCTATSTRSEGSINTASPANSDKNSVTMDQLLHQRLQRVQMCFHKRKDLTIPTPPHPQLHRASVGQWSHGSQRAEMTRFMNGAHQ
ncbi:hypothetical protein VTL71DRAFT_8263, partial [Oculimacula yallundae]